MGRSHNKKAKVNAHHQASKPVTSHPHRPPAKVKSEPPTIPFNPDDRILLIGEGDLSFAKSLVEEHGCCDVTATTFDGETDIATKYSPQGPRHAAYLQDEGQRVLYSVDATKLDQNKAIKKAREGGWDVVAFNFPHVGGKSKDVNRQVRFNQELLVKFFTGVQSLLTPTGTVVVTLFEGEPYTLWNLRDLARHTNLQVVQSFKFQASAYPGYSHARTLGNIEGGGGWKGEDRSARSFVLRIKGTAAAQERITKKRRRDGDSDGEDG